MLVSANIKTERLPSKTNTSMSETLRQSANADIHEFQRSKKT